MAIQSPTYLLIRMKQDKNRTSVWSAFLYFYSILYNRQFLTGFFCILLLVTRKLPFQGCHRVFICKEHVQLISLELSLGDIIFFKCKCFVNSCILCFWTHNFNCLWYVVCKKQMHLTFQILSLWPFLQMGWYHGSGSGVITIPVLTTIVM